MPRFFFHVHAGESRPDERGTELPDRKAARAAAIHHVGEILRGDAHGIAPGEAWRMEVTDADGALLFRLDFTVVEAPAPTHARASRRDLH